MIKIISAGLGGFIGAILRYTLSSLIPKLSGYFPIATLIVNVLGGLSIGFLIGLSLKYTIAEEVKIFLIAGLLGGLTTFSTFSYETVNMFSQGQNTAALLNTGLNVILSFLGVYLGKALSAVF